jgi:hypothetical protein
MGTLKQSYGEVHTMRNCSLLTTASKAPKPPDNNYMSEPSWKRILQLQSSCQMTATPTSDLRVYEKNFPVITQIPDPMKL